MSLIVRILNKMDQQLADAFNAGQKPDHFVMRLDEWKEIVERFKFEQDSPVTDNTYKGIPVDTGNIGDDNLAVLVRSLENTSMNSIILQQPEVQGSS